jgi:hypothetical protein
MSDLPRRATRSGSETRQRFMVARMRLTPGENAQLEVAAERAGMTVSTFMRHQCLGTAGPRAVRRPPVNLMALGQAIGHLGHCGSNLNQIAKALNSGGALPPGLPEAIAEVREAYVAIMTALGKRPRDC